MQNAQISIVKSTAPVLQEHGETLTRHFYRRMFEKNPEVLPFFNAANQAKGAQQRALAGAICAFAANVDNLGALTQAVELIAQKHASLQVKPHHYPIVGENLLASIREVLGDAATDEVIDAWAAGYGVLTEVLTKRESQIYRDTASKAGGWEGFRLFEVTRKEPECDIITSFYLRPRDGKALPAFLPGQYLTIRMPTPDGQSTMRNYSLSCKPGQDHFRISVKREMGRQKGAPNGYVSNKLHDETRVGDILEIGPPCGEFFFDPARGAGRPLVLLAAGVGITPIMSILQSTLDSAPDQEITMIYGAQNPQHQAFRTVLDDLAATHSGLCVHHCYSAAEQDAVESGDHCSAGHIDADLMKRLIPNPQADYYFCGPGAFMTSIHKNLQRWDIPPSQIHFEFFGPLQSLD